MWRILFADLAAARGRSGGMRLHLLAAAALLAAPAAVAAADGLPVGNLDTTQTGVAVPGAADRYYAIPSGRDTVVASVYRAGGLLQAHITLPGAFTIPAVAQDGTTSGLSANGRTLVLVRPRLVYPQRRTRLAVLDAHSLRLRSTITLHGDFSVDAIAPDGRSLYVIQYTSPRDPLAYAVRSLDLRSGRLDPGEIVDPRERDEAMHGVPMSRAMGPGGRWAYTLYDGGEGHPFVHALDTRARTARCIDLPALPAGVSIAGVSLAVRGSQLQVRSARGTVASIDRRTFAIAKRTAVAPVAADAPGDGFPWLPAAALAAAVLVVAVRLGTRRRFAT
jgi:hypothetical protein